MSQSLDGRFYQAPKIGIGTKIKRNGKETFCRTCDISSVFLREITDRINAIISYLSARQIS